MNGLVAQIHLVVSVMYADALVVADSPDIAGTAADTPFDTLGKQAPEIADTASAPAETGQTRPSAGRSTVDTVVDSYTAVAAAFESSYSAYASAADTAVATVAAVVGSDTVTSGSSPVLAMDADSYFHEDRKRTVVLQTYCSKVS